MSHRLRCTVRMLPPPDRCSAARRLLQNGYREVVTNAVGPGASLPLVDVGFAVARPLHLLAHDLRAPAGAGAGLRRARAANRAPLLEPTPPRSTTSGDSTPRAAAKRGVRRRAPTPASRPRPSAAHAYGLFGRAGATGYVQRLAVAPVAQRQGLGARAPDRRPALAARARGAARVRQHPRGQRARARALPRFRIRAAAGRPQRAGSRAMTADTACWARRRRPGRDRPVFASASVARAQETTTTPTAPSRSPPA